MVAWIALVVSTIALIVNLIVQRDKLKTFTEEVNVWLKQRTEKKKAADFLGKITNTESSDKKTNRGPFPLQPPLFLFSIMSSALLSLFNVQALLDVFALGILLYTAVSAIPTILLILIFVKPKILAYYVVVSLTAFLAIVIYGSIWAFATVLTLQILPNSPFYAGSIAGVFIAVYLWVSIRRAERK